MSDQQPGARRHGQGQNENPVPPEVPSKVPNRNVRSRQRLSRADLPAELTAETLRHLGLQTLRQLSRPGNGILDAEEQRQFDAALSEVTQGTASMLDESLRRAQHAGPGNLDPAMRRSYERTQRRLAEQARRARRRLPELPPEPSGRARAGEPDSPGATDEETEPAESSSATSEEAHDDVSPDTLAQQVEQTSETLDMLERIASLQQQQVEHQHSQLLSETRGFFFAFLVSVAVIIAGVAPLVDAEPHQRIMIVIWTVLATAVAGIVYALVRGRQGKKAKQADGSGRDTP